MKFFELESERLLYRKFNEDDFSIVFDWRGNAENMKYRSRKQRDELESRNYINVAIANV